MSRYNTGNQVPSSDMRDVWDNNLVQDSLINGEELSVESRKGKKLTSWSGLERMVTTAADGFGYVTLSGVSFSTGANVKLNEVLLNPANGEYYKWTGKFTSGSKYVPKDSTPETTGGIGPGAWLGVGDASLRQNLTSGESGLGGNLIRLESGKTLQQTIGVILLPKCGDIYDVFVIYGQSNAVGYANNTNNFPDVSEDAMWYDYRDSTFKRVVRGLAYSSGNVSTGHAWAAFANEYVKLTGRKVLFIPCARGESSVADLSKPVTPANTTYDKMIASVNGAIAAAAAAGIKTGYKSVLFHQGETDMLQGTAKETYQKSLDQLFRDMRSDMGLNKVFLYRVGNPQNRTEMSWGAMQAAQDYLCQSYDWMVMAYSRCGTFTGGNGLLREGVHYTQDGYNLMGSESASNVVRSLFEISPSAPAETEMYGRPLLPEDQIWRYSYGRLIFTEGKGFELLSKSNTGYSYRTINILSVEMLDATNRVRLHLQSRAQWILGLQTEMNLVGLQHGIKCSASLAVVDAATSRYALDLQFTMDITFALSMSGTLTRSPDLGSQVPPWVSGNVTAIKNATYNSVDVTHAGTQKFPVITAIAGSDFNGESGVVTLANVTSSGFSVKNTSGRGVIVTIPGMTIKPSTLMNSLQIGLQAIVCEKKE